jgi:hypothetical protein
MSDLSGIDKMLMRIFHPIQHRKTRILTRYLSKKTGSDYLDLKEQSNIEAPITDHLDDYEVVGALVAYLFSESTPPSIMLERHVIHKSWMSRFNESLFLVVEEVARDFRILGLKNKSLRLLAFFQLIATRVGQEEFARRFKERKKSIYRGSYGKRV